MDNNPGPGNTFVYMSIYIYNINRIRKPENKE